MPQAEAAPAMVPAADAASGRTLETSRPRVLIVDDDAIVREVLAEYLGGEYSLLAAPDGAGAMLTASAAVDALVTDLSMPSMNGLTLIRKARQMRPGLFAVLLTGHADDNAHLALSGAAGGTFSLLRKPVAPDQLGERIEALLAERPGAEPLAYAPHAAVIGTNASAAGMGATAV